MKKMYSFLTALVFALTASAQTTVTFDFAGNAFGLTTNEQAESITKEVSGVTLVAAKGASSTNPLINTYEYRMYKSSTATITAPSGGTITKIVFTGKNTTYPVSNITQNGTALTDGTWEGSAASVEFSNTAQARIATIEVTYTGNVVVKQNAALSFSESAVSIEQGSGTFVAPTLSKATNATVSYASSNTDVATVDASTGAVTFGSAVGTTTITASAPENDDYYAGSASYTITVFKYSYYAEVTQIESGKSYLIAAAKNDSFFCAQALAATSSYGYLSAVVADTYNGLLRFPGVSSEFTITSETEGYTIQDTHGRYLYQTGTYNSFNVSTSPTGGQYWTIEAQTDGTYKVTNKSVNKYVQYSPAYKSFGSYADAQTGSLLVKLYEKVDTPVGITTATTEAAQPAAIYDLSGRKVSKAVKGLYIVDGKKVYVK